MRDEYRRRMVEGYAMYAAYDRTHEGSLPRGEDERSAQVRETWRTEWRASLRSRATIERRFKP